ncbi:MAG: hypothetical protein PVS2B1_21900 [Candidatus Dormibacteraceae bacterium]
MTLNAILLDLYRKLVYPTAPSLATSTRLTQMVNDVLQELVSAPDLGQWFTQNDPAMTFVSVASQPVYALSSAVQRINDIVDRTNYRTLEMRPLSWYRVQEPNPTVRTGIPSVWIPLGFEAVTVQPSAAAAIFVKSDNAGDTGLAYLEGVRTGGYPIVLSATMTGVTAVAFGTTTDLIEVTKFYLATAAVGTVTLTQTSGAGTLLATIPIGQTFSRAQALALWPTPSSILTYTVDGERDLPLMINATDEPPIPARFHRLLVDGALWREYDKTADARAKDARKNYERGVAALRYFATCPPDYLPSRGRRPVGRSRYGAWTPADRF